MVTISLPPGSSRSAMNVRRRKSPRSSGIAGSIRYGKIGTRRSLAYDIPSRNGAPWPTNLKPVTIFLNGETADTRGAINVAELVERYQLAPETLLIEHNGLA